MANNAPSVSLLQAKHGLCLQKKAQWSKWVFGMLAGNE